MNKGLVKKKKIFFVILVILIMVAILLIIVNSKNNKELKTEVEKTEEIEEVQNNTASLETEVNPNSSIEDNPSIEGNDYIEVVSENIKVNTSKKLKEDKIFGIYKLTNINLQYTTQGTELTADVENTSTETVSGKNIKIEYYNNKGNVVSIMGGYMPQVKPEQTTTLSLSTTADVTNAYDFKIIVE